jgi:hypothetical protein
MTRLTLGKLYLANLQERLPGGRGHMTKEQAYEALKQYTGQDFGYDIKAWRKWLRENKKE